MRKRIEETAPDPLRAWLVEMVNQLMSAEVERSAMWATTRDFFCRRSRAPCSTRGRSLPGGLLEPRRTAEKALAAVVTAAHLLGVSTRKVEDLVQTLGIVATFVRTNFA